MVSMVAIRAHDDLNGQGYSQAYSIVIDPSTGETISTEPMKYLYLQQKYLGSK